MPVSDHLWMSELIGVIKDMNNATKILTASDFQSQEKDDESMLFWKSLALNLNRLNKKEAALAELKIQNILFEIEIKEKEWCTFVLIKCCVYKTYNLYKL